MFKFSKSFVFNVVNRLKALSAPLPFVLVLGLTACANVPVATGISDPHEARNRKTHNFNKAVDRTILRPLSRGYGTVTNGPISSGVNNFASNLSLPSIILNDLLQFSLGDATSNTARFVMNSTVGVAGLFDVAGMNGLAERSTDFGETLHVWGVGEGSYVELPFFGASTDRDAFGTMVDFVIDPLNYLIPVPERYLGTASGLMKKVGDRDRYAGLVESVLYESEDSYIESRSLYLQNRRWILQGEISEESLVDLYVE